MRAGRLLTLLLLLQNGGRFTARDLAERLEVSERTVLRDIETLSGAGVPVNRVRGPGGGFGGPMSGTNVLVERFTAVAEWSRLVDDRTAELEAALYDSGVASEIVDTWAAIVVSTGLVDQATADADAAQILAMVES